MKQSTIEDAIEQGQNALLKTYTITGHSDDIIEVNGPNLGNGLEFYPSASTMLIDMSPENSLVEDAAVISVALVNDQWIIGVGPKSDNVPLPLGEYTITASGYSATLTITTPVLLQFQEHN